VLEGIEDLDPQPARTRSFGDRERGCFVTTTDGAVDDEIDAHDSEAPRRKRRARGVDVTSAQIQWLNHSTICAISQCRAYGSSHRLRSVGSGSKEQSLGSSKQVP
jgi:hypothetical protein